jgi:hypothetical protein
MTSDRATPTLRRSPLRHVAIAAPDVLQPQLLNNSSSRSRRCSGVRELPQNRHDIPFDGQL